MIGDRYSLDREIGRGGMGAVWLGRDEVLGRPVAVKRVGVMPGGSSPDLMRAEREARIAASLNHPNIVGVYDLVTEDDQQYLIMEYVEGTTLAELVREHGALAPQQAARILTQVASALAVAHANQVVHRDVKPSNILVRDDGQVKLSDFGIARTEADAALTQTGLVTGSPAYLAPEVASGKSATSASDVWSLGATLFHALAGRPPYDVGDNVLGAMYQIVNEPPPRLENPGEMAPVLLATMAHDARRRWSMEDVARVLDLLAASTPVPPGSVPSVPTPVSTPVVSAEPHTQTLHSVAEPEPVAQPPDPAKLVAPAATVRPRRRRSVLPAVVGVLILALVVAIVVLALMDDPQDTADGPGETTTPSSSATPTPEPSESSTPTDEPPTAAAMESFIGDYLALASSNPEAAFASLTPAFQAESDQLDGYLGFWGPIRNARLLDFSADPEALTVTYTYRYNVVGKGSTTQATTLRLVRSDDGTGFLIDGEA